MPKRRRDGPPYQRVPARPFVELSAYPPAESLSAADLIETVQSISKNCFYGFDAQNEEHACGAVKLLIDAADLHPEDVELNAQFGMAVACLARNNTKTCEAFREADVAPRLLRAVATCYDQDLAVQSLCSALWNLAWDDNNKRYLFDRDVLTHIKPLLERSEDIVTECLGCLANIAIHVANKEAMRDRDLLQSMLSAMTRCIGNASVQTQGAMVLWNLAWLDENKQFLIDCLVLEQLRETMAAHPDNAGLWRGACGCIRNLTTQGSIALYLIDQGALATLTDALRFFNDAAVLEEACVAIKNILFRAGSEGALIPAAQFNPVLVVQRMITAVGNNHRQLAVVENACWVMAHCLDRYRAQIPTQDANTPTGSVLALGQLISGVTRAMEAAAGVLHIQEHVCWLLFNFTMHDDLRAHLQSTELRTELYKALQTFTKENTLTQYVLQIIRTSTITHDTVSLGHMEIVARVLEVYVNEGDIQAAGCMIIDLWSYSEANRSKLRLARCISALFAAMVAHPTHRMLQEAACRALRTVAGNIENKRYIKDLQGVKILKETMARFPQNAELLETALGALWNLSWSDDNKAHIREAGAIPAVLQAMRDHPNHAGVHEQGCGVLSNLALNEFNKTHLVELGTVDTVKDSLRTHIGSPAVVEQACVVVWNLASNDMNKVVLRQMGIIAILVPVMQAHASNPSILKPACGAMRNLAVNLENRQFLRDGGAVECVMSAMKTQSDKVNIQEETCVFMWNLSAMDEHKLLLRDLGLIEALMDIVRLHIAVMHVMEAALGIFRNMALNATLKDYIRNRGGIQSVLDAMDHCSTHAGVQEQACTTLWILAQNNEHNMAYLRARDSEARLLRAVQAFPFLATITNPSRQALHFLH